MDDVFGRPMDLTPKTFIVNSRPLAPNPLGPEVQTDPFGGARVPGDEGSEQPSTAEFMGAQYGISASRPTGLPPSPPALTSGGAPGGYPLPPAVSRE